MSKSPIRVLLIVPDFKKGGVQAEAMYPARLLSREDVVFDAIVPSDVVGYYEDEFKQYGQIYRIPIKRKSTKIQRFFSVFTNYFYVKKELKEFLKTHDKYDAIHARHHIFAAPCVKVAKKAGIPVRIAHASIDRPVGKYKNRFHVALYLNYCAHIIRKNATHVFGVTTGAVEYMAGKDNGIVMKNPTIALDKFNPTLYPNKNTGDIIRLIMVGSFSSRKNQKFTIEVLRELCKSRPDSTLTLIGYPRSPQEPYINEMKQMIKDYHLEENVQFLPQDTDIPKAMSESTFLMMPSIQEGLPNVALEAQAMGLPCYISTDVSTECDCGLCRFLPLDKGASYWAQTLIKHIEENGFEKNYLDMSEWDNKKICEDYLEYYRGNK
ncbi:MAG: glycosyltransferase [Ruminococcus sp.]|nr:glycosyltransferase [Ruminococcus sp.]